MQKIYFDHSATTPVDKPVLEAMLPYFGATFGNVSSIHSFGQEALVGVDQARESLAKFFNCAPGEVVFTSGATEANNLAIKGLVKALAEKGLKKMHVITSLIEHDAVLEPCAELEKDGYGVSHIRVKSNGLIDLKHFESLIKEETVLVSLMYVNSEIGTIQPIRAVGKMIKKINDKRLKQWKNTPPRDRQEKPQTIYFHTDATQAVNFENCDVAWNYVDLLSMSGHKIYGPKGVGALIRRKNVPISALQRGGHHENNLRSGTLNVPGIVGLGAAVAQITEAKRAQNNEKVAKLRDRLVAGVLKKVPDVVLNTDRAVSTPSHAHFSFLGVEGESILMALDLEGVAVSTGSACASGSLKASHVLLAIGIKVEVSHCSVRFTLGKHNTAKEVDALLALLPAAVERFRKMNPLYKK